MDRPDENTGELKDVATDNTVTDKQKEKIIAWQTKHYKTRLKNNENENGSCLACVLT